MIAYATKLDPKCAVYSGKPQRRWRVEPRIEDSKPRDYLESRPGCGSIQRELWIGNGKSKVKSLLPLRRAIQEARRILALQDNWDGEEAKPITESTFTRAANLLIQTARAIYHLMGTRIPVPVISPCADGSIDLYWKHKSFKLLVNVQPAEAQSDFYGESENGFIKGTFGPETTDLRFLSKLLS
jgi:hypothetical protein